MNRLLTSFATFLPIPALRNVMQLVSKVLNMSLTYTDELILAYNMRTRSTNPWESSKDALILYAQNYKTMLKNAVFLLVFMWIATIAVFAVFLAPAGILMALFPGPAGVFGFVLAVVLAWSFKAALLEPLAIASMMQVYFKVIEGQQPDAEWDGKLSSASKQFRELKEKAASFIPGSIAGEAATPS